MNMIMYKVGRYLPNDLMSELICDNYPMLLVMSRFGIDLGFGEDTIAQVCQKSGVDINTFLSVVNLLILNDRSGYKIECEKISLPTIINYLKRSHEYFLGYRLPVIRRELIEALSHGDDAVSIVIVKYYDEYVAEVNNHMMYEENILFPYITSVVGGSSSDQYSSDQYSEHHDKVASKLSELKSIIIKYYPSKTIDSLITVLYDIFSCERDLASHNDIEDLLLVPTLKLYETNKR